MSSAAARWKKEQRARLRAAKAELSESFTQAADIKIAQAIETALPAILSGSFSFYWPMRGEPDLRAAATRWVSSGAVAALPDTTRGQPLIFRPWKPGCAMRAGLWDIPVPDTAAEMHPAILLIPCLGFDEHGYRLGNGGGFYDRTLANLAPRPLAVGVAYSMSRISSIRPEAYDIPMDLVITETWLWDWRRSST